MDGDSIIVTSRSSGSLCSMQADVPMRDYAALTRYEFEPKPRQSTLSKISNSLTEFGQRLSKTMKKEPPKRDYYAEATAYVFEPKPKKPGFFRSFGLRKSASAEQNTESTNNQDDSLAELKTFSDTKPEKKSWFKFNKSGHSNTKQQTTTESAEDVCVADEQHKDYYEGDAKPKSKNRLARFRDFFGRSKKSARSGSGTNAVKLEKVDDCTQTDIEPLQNDDAKDKALVESLALELVRENWLDITVDFAGNQAHRVKCFPPQTLLGYRYRELNEEIKAMADEMFADCISEIECYLRQGGW